LQAEPPYENLWRYLNMRHLLQQFKNDNKKGDSAASTKNKTTIDQALQQNLIKIFLGAASPVIKGNGINNIYWHGGNVEIGQYACLCLEYLPAGNKIAKRYWMAE